MPYKDHYGSFWLTFVDEQTKERCNTNYNILVRDVHYPHTAFHQVFGLLNWANERGLPLPEPLGEIGVYSNHKIEGSYSIQSYMDVESFWSVRPVREIRKLDNGDYTLGRVTVDATGHHTIHYFNPNVHHRPIFDYRESQHLLEQCDTRILEASKYTPPVKVLLTHKGEVKAECRNYRTAFNRLQELEPCHSSLAIKYGGWAYKPVHEEPADGTE